MSEGFRKLVHPDLTDDAKIVEDSDSEERIGRSIYENAPTTHKDRETIGA